MRPKKLLKEAKKIVSGERQKDYGHPAENHECTATMWQAYMKRRIEVFLRTDREFWISAQDVCNLNILQKMSREANIHTDDNDVDIIGYLLNKAMIEEYVPPFED